MTLVDTERPWSAAGHIAFRMEFLRQLKFRLPVAAISTAVLLIVAPLWIEFLPTDIDIWLLAILLLASSFWFSLFKSVSEAQSALGTKVPRGSIYWVIGSALPAVATVVFGIVFVALLWTVWVKPVTPEQKNDLVRTVVAALGGLALLLQLRFAGHNTRIANQTLELSRQSQNAETFYKAVQQLDSFSLHARLGALHTLDQIARSNSNLYYGVMNTVAAFVATRAGVNSRENDPEQLPSKRERTDLSLAINLLANRAMPQKSLDKSILSFAELNLHGIHIKGGDLTSADFSDSRISDALFEECDLRDARFERSSLYHSEFHGCNLAFASFNSAILAKTEIFDFVQEDLVAIVVDGQKRLSDSLEGTEFTTAILQNAVLEVVDLSRSRGLTQPQLDELSRLGINVKLPSGLHRPE